MEYIGVDLAQKFSEVCELNEAGEVVQKARIPTTSTALTRWFGNRERATVCIEAGGSSPWVDRLLKGLGHEVVVCNPRRVRLIAESTMKTDAADAEVLARLVRADPQLLRPVVHRGEQTQLLRGRMRVRSTLLKARTASINTVRGLLRSFGYRLPRAEAEYFVARLRDLDLPPEVAAMVRPLLTLVAELSRQIKALDKEVQQACHQFPAAARLQTIPGVGPIVSLAYLLCLEEPHRFKRSRDTASYLGLKPTLRQSGEHSKSGGINKEGDRQMRALLIQAAQSLLRSKRDCALKAWGEGLTGRTGKKKAVVAVARKLAVLMHHLWVSGEEFVPYPGAQTAGVGSAA